MANSKENCIRLYELLQLIKSEESEMEQPRKFRFVNDREINVNHAELTVCNPDLLMTMLNQCPTSNDLVSQLFLYNSEDESSDSTKSLKRSQATINLHKEDNDTVLSTAEQHQITCINVDGDFKKILPKSTSSTTSLLGLKRKDSISFNVNVASTPKKVFHRTSAIRKAIRKQPLTSTLIKPEVKKSKKIPPPLLSSSIVPAVKTLKRNRSSSVQRKERQSKFQKISKQNCCKMCRKKITRPTVENLKYSVKFCPDKKTKDIDRVNEEYLDYLGYENNLKRCTNTNCYEYGDYNVWFL